MTDQNPTDKKPVFLAKPRDESLQAYKDFIMGMAEKMGIPGSDKITEAEWEKRWKEFYSNAKKGEAKPDE